MNYSEYSFEKVDLSKLETEVDSLIRQLDSSENAEQQYSIIKKFNQMFSEVGTYISMAHLDFSRNVASENAKTNKDYYDQVSPGIEELEVRFKTKLRESNYLPKLKELCGEHFFNLIDVKLLSFDSKLKPMMALESKLTNAYMSLLAKAQIDFRGKKHNLSGLAGFFRDKDRQLRRDSMFAYYDYFGRNAEELDDIYDKMVALRNKMALSLGYKNYVELGYKRLSRTDYGSKDVAVFRDEIREQILPNAKLVSDLKKRVLGIDKLKIYDGVYFRDGNPRPKGDHDEMVRWTSKMYRELSEETGDFFDTMVSEDLLDLKTRDAKSGGGFCTSFPSRQRPYIFANFNGSAGDVKVLTHEIGHAFQYYTSREYELIDYQWPTYEACEIHSMSMEFLTWPWMDLYFKEESERFKFLHLADSINFLPYGAMVDHFQHSVYENPSMSAKERKEHWLELEQIYRPGLDYDGQAFLESGGFWQGQGHIYFQPFYYIDYTLALTCAFQFWLLNEKDKKATWQKYIELCRLGGSQSFLGLLKTVELDSPFEKGVLKEASAGIMNWIKEKEQTLFN